MDSEYTLDVKKDVGLTDDDLKDQYQYTKDIVTVDGVQKGTTWQATPGLFAYRRSIAEDVLGTDDPTEVQAALSDWDKFNDVAEKAAAKGYKMLSGYDDSYRTFSNNVSAGWVDGTTVKVDPNIMNWSIRPRPTPITATTTRPAVERPVGRRSGPCRQGFRLLLLHLGHQLHPAGQLSGHA